jgi:2-polyprenyl-3-methyl-5-hydroxy-6-metoxy-1,4-benzoquinol methylase
MKRSGWNVTALEPDEGAREFAKKEHGLDVMPVEELFKLKHQSFDAITLWHVLEHVHDLPTYVAQLRDLLKNDGKLFIAVPNYTSFDAEVYGPSWAAYDVPRHLYHFNPASMSKLMSLFSLKITKMKPMWYDSFYVGLLSSKYKTGKTNWPEAIWTGLLSNIKAMDKKQGASSIIYIVSR